MSVRSYPSVVRARRRRRRWPAVLAGVLAACLLAGLLLAVLREDDGKGAPPWCIGLDAGHGGSDPGAQGLVSEAELTEQTTRALADLLETDDRFTVVLCHEWGETVERPSMRAEEGNRLGADLLLSIHANADTGGEAYGFECYPTPPGRKYHEQSLELAHDIADAFAAAGARLRGVAGVRYAYYEGENEDEKVIREESDTTEYPSQSFGFLESADCPAVLAEQCFITNAGDVSKFAGEEGAQRAAACYYRAICAYYGVEPLE